MEECEASELGVYPAHPGVGDCWLDDNGRWRNLCEGSSLQPTMIEGRNEK